MYLGEYKLMETRFTMSDVSVHYNHYTQFWQIMLQKDELYSQANV